MTVEPTRLVAERCCEFGLPSQVMKPLEALGQQHIVVWVLGVPAYNHPEDVPQGRLQTTRDPATR